MTRLRKVLKEKNITQKELSAKADVGEYRISRLCNGRDKNFEIQTAIRIVKVLSCSLDDAFGDIELMGYSINKK